MTAKTDAPATPGTLASAPEKKPRFAIFLATAAGLGYMPKAPGTFGSIGGLILVIAPSWLVAVIAVALMRAHIVDSIFLKSSHLYTDPFFLAQVTITILVAALGVWSASRAAEYWSQKDPQRVVIDEVSGQHIAILLGCTLPLLSGAVRIEGSWHYGLVALASPLNWKYLLVGFILFRLFDIWKPFPARQAESLPGGWGMMADDWIAGIYAAIGLWLARSAGL
jgi:phosphatidylglycerophosphatase A